MTTLQELPVLPLRDTLVFPELFVSIKVGRHASLAALKTAVESDRRLITVLQRQSDTDEPDLKDLHDVGTICRVTRVEQADGGAVVVVQGVARVRLEEAVPQEEYLAVRYEELEPLSTDVAAAEGGEEQARVDALLSETLEIARRIANLIDSDNGDQIFAQFMGSNDNAVTQMYRIASFAQQSIELEAQQQILAIESTRELLEMMLSKLSHQASVMQLRHEIASQTREDIDKQQREQLLRQQKRAIEQALGEEEGDEDLAEIKDNLRQANLPEAAQKEVERELKRLGRMSPNAADYQVARSYLELVAELPWNIVTEDTLDLGHAQKVLDEDHYGLEDVKERILESLAVLQLNPEAMASILCFVGPPGVGKTSLGQSIARAMSRKFERMSLGGLHDEAELRGHRRTYIGAMPGRILQAVRRAGVRNPVLMLDEIDKLGRDFRGDPAAALMEILDPAQNKEFRDNYLNLPFDLSKVLFITTANTLEGIPRPLLDRMEVLELTGYSELEKAEIARRYLIPRQQENAGLTEETFTFDDDALRKIIRRYTREAGVRELERSLSRIARKRARLMLQEETLGTSIETDELRDLLGPEKFKSDKGRENLSAGVAPGPRVDGDRGRRALRRGHAHAQGRQGDHHRALGPGHAGVGQGRPFVHLVRGGRPPHRPPSHRGLRRARPRAGRRRAEGRTLRRHHDGHRPRLRVQQEACPRRHRHDGRTDAHRARAARRRRAREDSGGAPHGLPPRHPAAGERIRARQAAGTGPRRNGNHAGRPARGRRARGDSGPVGTACPRPRLARARSRDRTPSGRPPHARAPHLERASKDTYCHGMRHGE